MKRTNTWQDAFNTGEVALDLGDGLTTRIPTGNPASRITALETAKVTVDNTVGRRAFAWDATNSRTQMIYGDTGWRQITPSGSGVAADNTGTIHLRRVDSIVWIRFSNVKPVDVNAALSNMGSLLVTGFRPVDNQAFGFIGDTGNLGPHMVALYNKSVIYVQRPTGFAASAADANYQGTFSFPTDDVWPTTLPGTAVGSIPT